MRIPTTLKHKPVLAAEDYGRIDGRTAGGSDAQGLSLGLAQWNDFQEEAYRFPRGYDPEHPQVDRIGLQGDAMTVEVCTGNDHIDEDLQLFRDALARDGELLGERMRVLSRILGELGCHG